MNKQGKVIKLMGLTKVVGGIEWTLTRHPDGSETRGATSNPVKGCFHDCKWIMPDRTIAECYAKGVAEGVAREFYPSGFEHHYWQPEELQSWLNTKDPLRIFWDSMADLFGRWVPDEQIQQVLDTARQAHWHTFQSLTKNAPRLLKFDLPSNVWPGVSVPPDFMWGKQIERRVQERMLHRILQILGQIQGRITWISFEPLAWDVSKIVAEYPGAIKWAVIGAASNGPKKFQPETEHVQKLLDVLHSQNVPVFFKGNLIWPIWREEFPKEKIPQLSPVF